MQLAGRSDVVTAFWPNEFLQTSYPYVFAALRRQSMNLWSCIPGSVRVVFLSREPSRAGRLTYQTQAWYYICINVMEAPMESAITVKGQATIPKSIREHLGLRPGDRVKFFVHPDGSVVLLPKLAASRARGIVKSRNPRPVTTEQMTAAVAESALSRNPRRRHR